MTPDPETPIPAALLTQIQETARRERAAQIAAAIAEARTAPLYRGGWG